MLLSYLHIASSNSNKTKLSYGRLVICTVNGCRLSSVCDGLWMVATTYQLGAWPRICVLCTPDFTCAILRRHKRPYTYTYK